MLTPQEIEKKVFVKAVFGGYEMASVDDFIETFAEDYNALYKENAILKSKLKVLVEKVEEYRSTEDVMRMTLLAAQKTSNEMVEEAKAKSEAAMSELDNAVNARKRELEQALENEEEKLGASKAATADFISAVRSVVDKYMDFFNRLDEIVASVPDKKAEHTAEAPADEAAGDEPPAAVQSADEALAGRVSAARTVEQVVASTVASAMGASDDLDATKRFEIVRDAGDRESDSDNDDVLRPRLNFENLKFGINYKNDD